METADALASLGPGDSLDAALERLDVRLLRALDERSLQPGQLDSFRGLYLREEEIRSDLKKPAGIPGIKNHSDSALVIDESGVSGFSWLARAFHLTEPDLDVLLIALAPEIDLRYERAYSFLQDDVTRKRPSVDLVLNLLAQSATEKRQLRRRFSSGLPLRRFNLIQLVDDPNRQSSSLLARQVEIDPQVLHLILGEFSLNDRLRHVCELTTPGSAFNVTRVSETEILNDLVVSVGSTKRPLKVNLFGADASNTDVVASNVAALLGMRLLALNVLNKPTEELVRLLPMVFRDAWFGNAILLIRGLESFTVESAFHQALIKELNIDSGVTIVETGLNQLPWSFGVKGLHRVEMELPTCEQRRQLWKTRFTVASIETEDAHTASLANAFRLTTQEIQLVVSAATAHPMNDGDAEICDIARKLAQELVNSPLKMLTNELKPTYSWDDIILSGENRQRLEQICNRVTYRHKVMEEWGFGDKLSQGKGTNALFSGPSGTGKTMAAEVIANELGMPLFRIDLATVVSKYIGETEKNLREIFNAAERANAVLFFDEADALFGKRSEVSDSHDRYANIEISYLLQMMEQYQGLSILATNLRGNLDDAFLRRLAFMVHFSVPVSKECKAIWDNAWPVQTPIVENAVSPTIVGHTLTGGNIKNMALSAAYLAAADDCPVYETHLLASLCIEYAKMGKKINTASFTPPNIDQGRTS